MTIETFTKLLQKAKKNAGIQARVQYTSAGTKRVKAVEVIYSPNGKVYTYKGTILDVAEKLGLIPEISYAEVMRRCENIYNLLNSGTEYVDDVAHVIDELRIFLNDKRDKGFIDWDLGVMAGIGNLTDEFGRVQRRFYKNYKKGW